MTTQAPTEAAQAAAEKAAAAWMAAQYRAQQSNGDWQAHHEADVARDQMMDAARAAGWAA